jgi:hypothetical protein
MGLLLSELASDDRPVDGSQLIDFNGLFLG